MGKGLQWPLGVPEYARAFRDGEAASAMDAAEQACPPPALEMWAMLVFAIEERH